ncbi:MAG: cyclic nucleotide-binding domain-containing protein [Patescibacteria group bacterium]
MPGSPEPDYKFEVYEKMPGCKIVFRPEGSIMLGCPSEVLKLLTKLGSSLGVPKIIILPAYFFQHGVNQAALEFILYHFLFIQGGFFKGEKFTLIGTADQISRMRAILELSLNGPTREQMESWKTPEKTIQQVLKLSYHFGLKKPGTNQLATIDSLVDFVELNNNGQLCLGNTIITSKDTNVFSFKQFGFDHETIVDINIAESQRPPIPIPAPESLPPRAVLGATALSKCSTGFDQTGYTSGLIFWINGMGVSVDGVAWMKEHLRILGVNPDEIKAHIVTHIHDDHSSIFDLIVNGKIFKLIADKLQYHCLVLKASLVLNLPVDKVKRMIKLLRVVPGTPFHWHGATFDFWPVAHPIPTLGFKVTVAGKSMVYSGDTVWGSKLTALRDAGVIDSAFHDKVQGAALTSSELTFHDAGGGMIHPDLAELAALPEQARRHIVPTHLASIPTELADKFNAIIPGQSWVLSEQQYWSTTDFLQISHAPILSSISDEWMNVVISQGKIKAYPANYTLLKEGESGKNFYLIIGGSLEVMIGGEEIAQLSTGDFFGEISIMYGIPCTATIRTKSPVKVLELPRDLFTEMVNSTELAKTLEKIHQIRPILLRFTIIEKLPPHVVNELVAAAHVVEFNAGETIINQGEPADRFYGIISGKANVFWHEPDKPKKHVAMLYKEQCFGEVGLLGDGVRTADVEAETPMKVFYLSRTEFDRIVGTTPMLFYSLGILANVRSNN